MKERCPDDIIGQESDIDEQGWLARWIMAVLNTNMPPENLAGV